MYLLIYHLSIYHHFSSYQQEIARTGIYLDWVPEESEGNSVIGILITFMAEEG